MKIKTTKQVIQKAVQVGEIAQHDRIYFCDSTPRARRYVDVEELKDYLVEIGFEQFPLDFHRDVLKHLIDAITSTSHNRNLQVTPSASPKEATLPSVNSDIKCNKIKVLQDG